MGVLGFYVVLRPTCYGILEHPVQYILLCVYIVQGYDFLYPRIHGQNVLFCAGSSRHKEVTIYIYIYMYIVIQYINIYMYSMNPTIDAIHAFESAENQVLHDSKIYLSPFGWNLCAYPRNNK
jgi:hypothetical protein